MRLTSFGRSFLVLTSCRPSPRRLAWTLRAARRRWPDGRVAVDLPLVVIRSCDLDGNVDGWSWEWQGWSVRFMVGGTCGLLLTL